jgi:hypothetical protein
MQLYEPSFGMIAQSVLGVEPLDEVISVVGTVGKARLIFRFANGTKHKLPLSFDWSEDRGSLMGNALKGKLGGAKLPPAAESY